MARNIMKSTQLSTPNLFREIIVHHHHGIRNQRQLLFPDVERYQLQLRNLHSQSQRFKKSICAHLTASVTPKLRKLTVLLLVHVPSAQISTARGSYEK
ncbi:hypothetical protein HAX54_031595, partial [Datura stramonium]|nr:hypothetical protein [Datura stramonium]